MAATNSVSHPVQPNRRRRVRHKIQTPAYATFSAESKGVMLDLHEIVDISEEGAAIQCHSPLEIDKRVSLCLDLADCPENIHTTGQVVWSNDSGRAGLRFSELPPESLSRLREWLFVNVMAGVANGEAEVEGMRGVGPAEVGTLAPAQPAQADEASAPPPRPNFTDTLAAVTAVQRQVEALGADLPAALQLVAERAQTLVRASGAAIALADSVPDFMTCRASAGPDAPPVGARLQVGSGFSGECVKTGQTLRCNDAELDDRVDRESCRALGIRSILATPVHVGEKSVGLVEVFSAQPDTFSDSDASVLQRLAESVLHAVNRAADAENLPQLSASPLPEPFQPVPGSVLFASAADAGRRSVPDRDQDKDTVAGVSLPRAHLFLLIAAAAIIFGILGYATAPLLQSKIQQRSPTPIQTVLASSRPPAENSPSVPSVATATLAQLRQMAEHNDAAAENALGLRYFQGDEKDRIERDEKQAFDWFSRAAEDGSLPAQAKLGALYWGGRGVAKNLDRAYFWAVLARARGDKGSRDLALILRANYGMSRNQAAVIEQEADLWLQQHMPNWKPSAGR